MDYYCLHKYYFINVIKSSGTGVTCFACGNKKHIQNVHGIRRRRNNPRDPGTEGRTVSKQVNVMQG